MHTLGAGIGVRVETQSGLPPLRADKGQLETVLVNLATNARDAMSGNGVLTFQAIDEILPKVADPRPIVDVKPGRYIRLTVTDTGTGMTPEILKRVAEPFFTTKPLGRGTGLGLAMARGFIEQSGGALLIESEAGSGTQVHLWLPVAEVQIRGSDRKEITALRGQAARLMLVDDEPLVRETLAGHLQYAGFSVIAVESAEAALAALDAGETIDLLITDLSMPGMNGVALMREVNRRLPQLPSVLLTGFATSAAEVAVGGTVGGLFSLMRKPVNDRELHERITMLLAGAGSMKLGQT